METFTDPRDNNSYKVVKINNLLWFAENLRYKGVEHHFPDRNSENVEKYGYLYTWKNAMEACPPGWRLPTKDEFEKLVSSNETSNNSSSLRDESWNNGSNFSGFGALPAGLRWHNGVFYSFGLSTIFWSATPRGNVFAYYLGVVPGQAYVYDDYRNNAVSVRCVKDID